MERRRNVGESGEAARCVNTRRPLTTDRSIRTEADGIMPVTKRTRYEVLKRDNHTCRYCGATADDGPLTIDHVTPVALGGSNDPSNLVTACRDCNYGKGSTSPDAGVIEDVKQADIKWADAIRRAADIRAAERKEERAYTAEFFKIWDRWCPDAAADSLIQMRNAGLTVDEMKDAAMIALCNYGIDDRWRYFCGVAWRKVAKLQEMAKALLEADEAEGA